MKHPAEKTCPYCDSGKLGIASCKHCAGTGHRFRVEVDGEVSYFPATREGFQQAEAKAKALENAA